MASGPDGRPLPVEVLPTVVHLSPADGACVVLFDGEAGGQAVLLTDRLEGPPGGWTPVQVAVAAARLRAMARALEGPG